MFVSTNLTNKIYKLQLYSPSFYQRNCQYLPPHSPAIEDMGFPDGSDGKESACLAGDPGSIPGSGRFPGVGNGYPLQYSCLENSMDREAW